MSEASLTPSICYTSGNLDYNKNDINAFLDTHTVDGVIGVRDSIAIVTMNILISRGMSVPEDVSIYGFQNTRQTLLCRPELSSVHIPIYEIGARAMKVLTNEMLGQKQETNKQIRLQHSIMKRGTTK